MRVRSEQIFTHAVREHDVVWMPDPQRKSYFLPPGHDFLDTIMDELVTVFVDDVELKKNAYTSVRRARLNPSFAPHPSVQDAAIGIRLAVAPTGPVRIRWQERALWGLEDPVVARVRVTVGNNNVPVSPRQFDIVGAGGDAKAWAKLTYVDGDALASRQTNAVELPRLPEGYLWEVWRRTRRDGGGRGHSVTRYPRDGRRFVPYIRLPQAAEGKTLYHWSDLGLSRRRHITCFRAYDPATGARGPFSRETIRWSPAKDACWTEGSPAPTQAPGAVVVVRP